MSELKQVSDNDHTEGQSGLGAITHFWCEVCGAVQPTFFEGANNQNISGEFVGGDIVCKECAFIIATAYVPNDKLRGAL